jgi:hypothetical protein
MMQCVTCNNLSLFAPRLKILKKQRKYKFILVEQTKTSNVLEMKNTNSFLYEFRHEQHCNPT